MLLNETVILCGFFTLEFLNFNSSAIFLHFVIVKEGIVTSGYMGIIYYSESKRWKKSPTILTFWNNWTNANGLQG